MRIAVLMGGTNLERDVSLSSGLAVAGALAAGGHQVAAIDTAVAVAADDPDMSGLFAFEPPDDANVGLFDVPPDHETLRVLRAGQHGHVFAPGVLDACLAADAAFITVYGDEGESGHVQAVLDLAGLPYTGPPPLACAVSFDKDMTKRVLRACGIPTPEWRVITRERVDQDLADLDLAGPWIVKPVSGGSTIGLSSVLDPAELAPAVRTAHDCGSDALVEAYVDGPEFSVGILGDAVLPVVEIRTDSKIFDYRAKYQPGVAEEICPAQQPDDQRADLQQLALRAHRALKAGSTCSRVDFRMDGDGAFWCLEVNALPGMTATSLYPQAAAATGLGLTQLCDELVGLATVRGGGS